jgi:hypothetical protein
MQIVERNSLATLSQLEASNQCRLISDRFGSNGQ